MKKNNKYMIETYITESGYYVIQQCDIESGKEAASIELTSDQMYKLAREIDNVLPDVISKELNANFKTDAEDT